MIADTDRNGIDYKIPMINLFIFTIEDAIIDESGREKLDSLFPIVAGQSLFKASFADNALMRQFGIDLDQAFD